MNNIMMSNDSIKMMAESIGITNLGDDACRELSIDLTFTLKSILMDAQKFARRSRRKGLTTADIDHALKARSLEPVYGFYSNDSIPFRSATVVGGTGGGRTIHYPEDQVVDLNELINTNNSSIKLPNDFVINAHWLAIEGVQPSLPENPQLISREMQKKDAIEGATAKTKQMQQTQQTGENYVKLKSILPHDLSMEQQIYFKEITEACVGSDESKRTEALNSLTTDPGLHQLLPRFVLFITEGVRLNIIQFNMAILIYLMRMAKSLIENKAIYLEKYLHELLPAIMSCLLSKQLCLRPDVENHYAIREFCARLVGQIIKIYGPTLTNLQTRIIKVFLNSLQSDKTTFSTLFGAIVGFAELGNEICEAFIFPLVKPLGERVAQILDSTATNQEKIPAERVKQELVKIIGNVLKTKQQLSSDEFDYLTTEFGAYFGQLVHSQLAKLRSQAPVLPLPKSSTSRQQSNNLAQPHGQPTTQIQYITPRPITNPALFQKQQQPNSTQQPSQSTQPSQQQPEQKQTQQESESVNNRANADSGVSQLSSANNPISFDSTIQSANSTSPASNAFSTSSNPSSVAKEVSLAEKIDNLAGNSLTTLNIKSETIQVEEEVENQNKINESDSEFRMDMGAGNANNDTNANQNDDENGDLPDHADDWLFYS